MRVDFFKRIRKTLASIILISLFVSIAPVDIPYIAPIQPVRASITDPTDISGLRLWLDADDTSTLHTDAACTSGAPSDGADVLCWEDKSGNDDDVTEISGDCDETTGGTQTCGTPVLRQDEFNGNRNALEFVRSEDDALRKVLSASEDWTGTNFTLFIAFEQVGTPDTYYSFFSNGNPAGSDHFQIDTINDSGDRTFRANGVATSSPLFEPFANELKLYAIRGTSTSAATFADGEQLNEESGSNGRTFDQYRINQNRQGNHRNNAKIAEIIIYDTNLTNCEMGDVYQYLGDKYGRDFGGGTPGGVSCLDIESWFKADQGVTVSGSDVTDWQDQGPNDNDADQSTSGERPDLVTNALNYNPVLRFDGSDDNLDLSASFLPTASGARSYYVVTNPDSGSETQSVLSHGTNATGQRINITTTDSETAVAVNGHNYGLTSGSTEARIVTYELAEEGDSDAFAIRINGADQTETTIAGSAQTVDTGTTDAQIGGDVFGASNFDGDIAELMAFGTVFNTTSRNAIESYLAIKYGITLDSGSDYVDDSGTSVYDSNGTHSSYTNDIAGIARDDDQSLTQPGSTSINSDAIVTMTGSSSLDDGDFLLWGNDNGSTGETSSNMPDGIARRLTRIWRVDETGDTGTGTIQFDLTGLSVKGTVASDFMLISDNDTTFTSGASASGATSFTSNIVTFENVNLGDNQYFTLGTKNVTPGGVDDVELWLKANDGVTGTTNVSQWDDQSGNGNHATQGTGDNQPSLATDEFNFNPVIRLDGSNDYMDFGSTNIPIGSSNRTIYMVMDRDDSSGYRFALGYGNNASNQAQSIGQHATATTYIYAGWASDILITNTWGVDTPLIAGNTFDGTTASSHINGDSGTSANRSSWNTADSDYYIGRQVHESEYWDGDIAEIIITSDAKDSTDRQKIESYLGIKYGITLSGGTLDYLSSSGETIWDASGNSSYNNFIAGIGRDDVSELYQYRSQSIESGALLTMSGTIADFLDHEFIIWGHNSGSLLTSTGSDIPSGSTSRLQRVWRVDETGDTGMLDIQFDLSLQDALPTAATAGEYQLLVDSDGTFSNATIAATGDSLSSNIVTFDNVTALDDGEYFTLAYGAADAPGDVGHGLLLWLDANDPDDDGNTGNNPSDGSTVSTWHDKSNHDNDATVVSGETAATFESAAGDLINGHPVLYFDRTNQNDGSVYETLGVDIRAATNEDITIFTVYQPQEAALGAGEHYGVWGADNGSWDRFFSSNHINFGDGVDDGLASLGPVSQGAVVEDAGVVDQVRVMAAVYDGEVSGGVNAGPTNGSTIYFNGTVVTRFTDETDDLDALDHLYIGWDGDNGPYDGDIAEVIVYNRILDCIEFNNVTAYLSNKYGQSFSTISPGGVSCSVSTWLKADAGVTETSGKVSTWTDQTGNGHNATQGTNDNRPNFVEDGINFNPVLEFKGNSEGDSLRDYLDFTSGHAAAMHGADNSYFFVFNSNDVTGIDHVYYVADGTGTDYNGGGDTEDILEMHFGLEQSSGGKPRYFMQDGTNAENTISIYGDSISNDETVLVSSIRSNLTAEFFVNSTSQGTDTVNGDEKSATNTRIGGHQASFNYERFLEGQLAELIVYTTDVSSTERQQIESYLGIKYGLTLSGGTMNYLSSSGETVWNVSTNTGYNNDIAGVGREDLSSLSQFRSTSQNSDSIVTMSGTTSNFADHEFMLWGNDNGSLSTWSTNDSPGGYARVPREWKVQETGDVGSVTVSVDDADLPVSSNDVFLLTDTDGSFSNATVTTMTDSSGTWSASIDISDGTYFSFAVSSTGPGGVSSGMTLWLKGDAGVTGTSQVSDWADQSGNSRDFTQGTGSNQPALTDEAINFNPALTFDGSNHFLEDADGEDYINGYSTYSSFMVVDSDATNDGFIFFSSNESSNSEAPWGIRYDQSGFETGHSNIMKFGVGTTTDAHKLYEIDENNAVTTDPLLVDFQWTSGAEPVLNLYNAPKPLLADEAPQTIGGTITGADYIRIGRQSEAGHSYWDGHIAEIVLYEEDVTEAEEARISSYLAIKYGLTLSGGTVNYVSASGSTVWDSSVNSGYHHDIAGLGRDNASALTQYQSRSEHSDSILTMSGSISSFSDFEFITWGNNDASTSFSDFVPIHNANERFGRVWKTQETGDTGILAVTFTGTFIENGRTYYLLKDNDGDFSNGGSTEIASAVASGNSVTFDNSINLSTAEYITFGRHRQKHFFQFLFF